MKKHEFTFRIVTLIVCTAIAVGLFYVPQNNGTVEAEFSELRGIWVATVSQLDYPSTYTTDADVLKNDLITILDNAQDMGFNSVFFQVRPAGDALYKSEIFPWSKYLSGTQGVAPDDGFDPLAFAVEEAHKRGLELHAWINPYRVTNTASDNDQLAANNPAVLRPELTFTASDGKIYYNPGEAEAIDLIIQGAVEIAANYDVDGIHMDDYFYPSASFNDDGTYAYYQDSYPNKDDWRRSMVDTLVREMHNAVHEVKPNIQFGIAPSGIWANSSSMPEGSDTRGNQSYFSLYADTKGWVEKGYVDYIMPQLYWNIGYELADYTTLLNWWSNVVASANNGVKLYIGEGAYRTVSSTLDAWTGENGTNELRTHIAMGRENPNVSGYCMYTYNTFLQNPSIYSLMQEVNATPAEKLEEESSPTPSPEAAATPEPEPAAEPTETPGPADANGFTDMGEYQWAQNEITSLVQQGIIRGVSETEFAPDSYITRADNTALLLRVLGKTAEFTDNFDDVTPDKYYYEEIGMARALGITEGVGNNLFAPEQYILRQDMATLAYRVLREEGVLTAIPNTGVLNVYADVNYIDFYARDAMAACVGAGLMSGYGDNTIRPQEYASRIEVALFIYRIQQLIQA